MNFRLFKLRQKGGLTQCWSRKMPDYYLLSPLLHFTHVAHTSLKMTLKKNFIVYKHQTTEVTCDFLIYLANIDICLFFSFTPTFSHRIFPFIPSLCTIFIEWFFYRTIKSTPNRGQQYCRYNQRNVLVTKKIHSYLKKKNKNKNKIFIVI